MQKGSEKSGDYTTGNQSFTIKELEPGTTYHFEIFPQGPDGTEGPSRTVDGRTGEHPDIDVSYRCLIFKIYFSFYKTNLKTFHDCGDSDSTKIK